MFRLLKIFLFIFLFCHQLHADVLVRMEVQQGVTVSNVDLRLFDGVAPITADNFLKYVNDTTINGGNYNNLFIHRSVTEFIIQGGGFTFDPLVNDGSFTYDKVNDIYLGGLQDVSKDPAILNEFNKSNLRGTISMAKLAGDPNSATSQWFINLADNSSILDGQNEGFTVFGEVISDGMIVIDEIASQSKYNRTDIHTAFGELPLINYTSGSVQQDNLVRINTMAELLSISADIDFKTVLLGTAAQSVLTIKNTGSVSHSIGDIATTDAINSPFIIVANTCSNKTLGLAAVCTLTLEFSPQSENVFNETFNIELTDLALSFSFSLQGEGVLAPPAPDISVSVTGNVIEFGGVQLGKDKQIIVVFSNAGNLDLNVTSMTLDGVDAAEFEIFDNCVNASPVAPSEFCVMPINFTPSTTGEKSARLTVISDDS